MHGLNNNGSKKVGALSAPIGLNRLTCKSMAGALNNFFGVPFVYHVHLGSLTHEEYLSRH